jgi:hypothetical protein
MAAFRKIDQARTGRLWSLANSLKFPGQVPTEGFPVIIGEKSLLVGDRLYRHGLEQFGAAGNVLLQDGQPGFLEVSCYLETTKAPLIVVLRIPVPAAARQEAARAAAHLESQVTARDRDRLRSTFGDHFEAVGQQTDAPHRMQRRRKIVIPVLALFLIGLAGFLLYTVVLRQRAPVPNETFPALPDSGAPSSDLTPPSPANESSPPPPG